MKQWNSLADNKEKKGKINWGLIFPCIHTVLSLIIHEHVFMEEARVKFTCIYFIF